MIRWFNENAAAVSAFASIVLMMTTIVYAWHTRQLSVENRLLRKAGTDPRVVAYVSINPYVYSAMDFVIRNVGNGAARNVSYEIVLGGEDIKEKGISLPQAGVKYAFLAQGDKISNGMGMSWDVLGESAIRPFEVEVSYEDLAGKGHKERFRIDFAPFEGLRRIGKPPDEEIVESLKKIASLMEGWAMRRLQVETMSVKERREHDEETRQFVEERKRKREGKKGEDGETEG